MQENVTPSNGMTITEDTRFASGVYHLPDGIRIGADNISIEGDNTTILSDVQTGVGVQMSGQTGVSIRNLSVSGYYHGLRCDDCRNLTLENVTIRNTQEIEGIETFLYLWLPVEKSYGGALLFNNVRDSSVQDCDFQHQMHGVLLYNSERVTVQRVNASFNSGWGVYLSNASHCTVEDNQLDFCNRVFRRDDGSIRVEADASGIVLVKGSSHNVFRRNSCLCGGDGIFLCGYEHPGVITPCNYNLFEENDCRLSPNNAVESTFSEGNIYRNNDCSRSNYGFWMGYSHKNTLEGNNIEFNRFAGVAIEHGFDFDIVNNTLNRNGEGVRLWTRGGAVIDYFPDRRVSFDFRIKDNLFEGNNTGFVGDTGAEISDDASHHFMLEANQFNGNRIGANFGRVRDCSLSKNVFTGNLVAAVQVAAVHKDGVTLDHDNIYGQNATNLNEV
jgi:parallel beta-helix repeat protein